MGASRQAYWWERVLHAIPGMTMRCPDGNRHFRWQRVCWCRNDLWVSIRVSGQWLGFRRDRCQVVPMAPPGGSETKGADRG
jgi:hypothetical protein